MEVEISCETFIYRWDYAALQYRSQWRVSYVDYFALRAVVFLPCHAVIHWTSRSSLCTWRYITQGNARIVSVAGETKAPRHTSTSTLHQIVLSSFALSFSFSVHCASVHSQQLLSHPGLSSGPPSHQPARLDGRWKYSRHGGKSKRINQFRKSGYISTRKLYYCIINA
jgi:hypothetical protein